MGCRQSKEAMESGVTAMAHTFQGVLKPANDLAHKVESMAAALLPGEKGALHHLRNVFVAPLGDLTGFTAPSFPKSDSEKKLLLKALRESFVFASFPDKDLGTMVGAFEKTDVDKGAVIIQQGDTGDYFYVLKTGTVLFEVDGVDKGKAGSGASFGELALLYSSPRAASAIAETYCEIFRVGQKTFRKILQSREEQTYKERLELVSGVDYFKDLDSRDIAKLAKILKPRLFKEGEYLSHKGESSDTFFIIQRGQAEFKNITVGGKKYEDQTLGPGKYAGEGALTSTDDKRYGDLIGKTPGLALLIEKEVFQKTMGSMDALVLKNLEKRQLGAIKILADTGLDSVDLSTLAGLMTEQTFRKNETIFESGKPTDAAVYLVREGLVGKTGAIIKKLGYFGEEQLKVDVKSSGFGEALVKPEYTATALEDCRLGVLKLTDCRTVFDTTRIGQKKEEDVGTMERKIQLQDLKKHSILGAGTFGQVWLVSHQGSDGTRRPYALKIQLKHDLIETGQVQGVVREKNVMSQLKYQFLMKLVKTFQDPQRIYMLLGLVQGGELRSILYDHDRVGGLPEKEAKFYAAGLLDGLSFMHSRHIIHRDLKPENVMINDRGYPVLIDFGFAKYVPNKTYTFCGTPLYIAPELLLNRGHDRGADHWSVGVMIYEMMTGFTPFYVEGMDQMALFQAVLTGKIHLPNKGMSGTAKGLILSFLEREPSYRLGSLAGGLRDIYAHPWFVDLDFRALRNQAIKAPWLPEIKDPLDNSNFSDWSHLKDKDKVKKPPLSQKDQALFETF